MNRTVYNSAAEGDVRLILGSVTFHDKGHQNIHQARSDFGADRSGASVFTSLLSSAYRVRTEGEIERPEFQAGESGGLYTTLHHTTLHHTWLSVPSSLM